MSKRTPASGEGGGKSEPSNFEAKISFEGDAFKTAEELTFPPSQIKTKPTNFQVKVAKEKMDDLYYKFKTSPSEANKQKVLEQMLLVQYLQARLKA